MEIETKVISSETMKPSSPTPKFLQKHQLSLLDQLLAPSVLAPFVYCYLSHSKTPNSQKSYILKKSLSETLSRFYPLAGRLVGNLYVDCNDSGVPLIEAVANCDLSQVITNPDPKRIKKLLLPKIDEESKALCIVQATYFRCGGLTLGLLIQHKIVDASSIFAFINSWAAVARNGDLNAVPIPKFDAVSYFPQRDIQVELLPDIATHEEEVATKIFTVSAAKIASLREKYSVGDHHPSRVEALLAHLWTRFLSAQVDRNKIYCVQQAINLRSRMDPPLSESHIGNIYSGLLATVTAEDSEIKILDRLKRAKKAMHDNYAAQLKDLMLQLDLMNRVIEKGELVTFSFSSLCGFPLYEADFGWGEPVWVVVPGFPGKNIALFTDTKTRGGIEVLIHLSKPDMDRFEADLELPLFKSNL